MPKIKEEESNLCCRTDVAKFVCEPDEGSNVLILHTGTEHRKDIVLSGRVMPSVSNQDFAVTQTRSELICAHMLC